MGVVGNVGIVAREGIARDEATGEDIQEAGVVVVVAQSVHVKERLGSVSVVGLYRHHIIPPRTLTIPGYRKYRQQNC